MCVDMKASLGESRWRTVRSVSRREVLHAHSSTLFKSGEFITGDFSPFRLTHSAMMTTLILLLTTLGFFPQGQTLFISTVWWSAESGNLHFPHWQCSPTVLEVLFILLVCLCSRSFSVPPRGPDSWEKFCWTRTVCHFQLPCQSWAWVFN